MSGEGVTVLSRQPHEHGDKREKSGMNVGGRLGRCGLVALVLALQACGDFADKRNALGVGGLMDGGWAG